MAELIEQELGTLKTQVIENSFLLFEAHLIKAIPLCSSAQPDSLYFSCEKNGVYSVKLGYKFTCEDSRSEAASGSTRSVVSGLWIGMWKLEVPVKIKHFLWKACFDSLPTKVNLMKRKILADPTCHLCGKIAEDTKHALWDVEAVKAVWCMDFNWVNRFEVAHGSLLDLVDRLLSKSRVAELFATMAWFTWTHRNKQG